MVITREISSKISRKYELYGVHIAKLFSEKDLKRIIEFSVEKNRNKKHIGPKNSETLTLDITLPLLDVILGAFPEEKRELKQSLKHAELYFINDKQKKFTIDSSKVAWLVVGNTIEIHVNCLKEHVSKTFNIQDGSLIFLDHDLKEISFDSVDKNEEFFYDMRKDACNLFLFLVT